MRGGEAPKGGDITERKHKKPKEVTITRNPRGGGKEGERKEKTRNGSPIISASPSALSLFFFLFFSSFSAPRSSQGRAPPVSPFFFPSL
jgi:hypothetical protein